MGPRKLLPSPSMVVSIVAVVLAAGGASYAGTTIANNSVGSAQVKTNSLTGSDIQNNSLKGADIRNGAVKSQDIVDSGVTGDDIDDGAIHPGHITPDAIDGSMVFADSLSGLDILESSLGQVPLAAQAGSAGSAASAADAEKLGGRSAAGYVTTEEVVPLRVALAFGERKEVVTNGPVGLEVQCRENVATTQDEVRMLAVSRVEGAFMQGDLPSHGGPGIGSDYLTPATADADRVMGGMMTTEAGDGMPAADDDIDTSFVAGPAGQYIAIDETTMYALNVGGSDCLLVGHAFVIK